MKAVRLVAVREPLEVAAVPDPSAGPDDAVVRVSACGLCRSDWHLWQGDWSWEDISLTLDRKSVV